MCFLSKRGTVSPSYLHTSRVTNKWIISINGKGKLSSPQKLIWSRILSMKILKKNLKIYLWKIDLIIFEIKRPLFPLSAFKYDKRIIEIREVVRVEKSAIIHCAMFKRRKIRPFFSILGYIALKFNICPESAYLKTP